ncbi:amidoligase family protein [Pseudaestuariivita rosea]|uniref:amidoligase family protein n=1 Tax=Pseudaestuariivita rosea TaxID=2763263 RepID=UPI001ABAE4BC|nr:amidoligase family protein [Pseudaestuariivita rosea]
MTNPLLSLPRPENADGDPRLVGVEIELGGLDERQVADVVAQTLGGHDEKQDKTVHMVRDTRLGDIKVYLDTRFQPDADSVVANIARTVVPIEIVTQPTEPALIPDLDALCARLREAGATGTQNNLLLGFGVHLNIQITGDNITDILPTLTAFALLEDYLRATYELDTTRRILPFTAPYPRRFVDKLVSEPPSDIDALARLYLDETPSRNRGLDMLPILAHLRPDFDYGPSTSSRPAYHYRMPDCRIDDPDWSITGEWNRWVRIESIAHDQNLLDELKAAWIAHRSSLTTIRPDWHHRVDEILRDTNAGIPA